MIRKKIKENKGITGIDATIAVVILMIFVPLITSLFSNITSVKQKVNRKTTAVNIAIQVIEGTKMMNYDSISGEKLELNQVLGNSGNYTSENIPNGYETEILVAEQEEYKDIIVNVKYLENTRKESVELKARIYKE